MIWQIKPFSHRCCISDKPFEPGDRYVSFLVMSPENEMQRFDVLAEREKELTLEGELICRWRQVYKKEPEKDDSAQRQKATAEGLFFSLFQEAEAPEETGDSEEEGEAEESPENEAEEAGEAARAPVGEEREAMKKFLGLFLERRRILKNRGKTPDGEFMIMEHMKTRSIFMVPAGNLQPEEVMKIGERLGALVK